MMCIIPYSIAINLVETAGAVLVIHEMSPAPSGKVIWKFLAHKIQG